MISETNLSLKVKKEQEKHIKKNKQKNLEFHQTERRREGGGREGGREEREGEREERSEVGETESQLTREALGECAVTDLEGAEFHHERKHFSHTSLQSMRTSLGFASHHHCLCY